jgi:hypothetical protein
MLVSLSPVIDSGLQSVNVGMTNHCALPPVTASGPNDMKHNLFIIHHNGKSKESIFLLCFTSLYLSKAETNQHWL